MARTTMVFSKPTLKLAETEAELVTGQAFECQVTQFAVDANVTMATIPATGCAGASDSPANASYTAQVVWLQDWSAGAAASLSSFVWEHKNEKVWVEMTPDSGDPTTKITGEVWMTPGTGLFGGTFGDGSAGLTTASWPYTGEPTIAAPVTLTASSN